MAISAYDRKLLRGTGIDENHVKNWLDYFDTVLAALNTISDRIVVDATSGILTIYLDSAHTAAITYNATGGSLADPAITFAVAGAIEGTLEESGWVALP